MDLTNKTVLITGAGSGIGRAIACAFAKERCNLFLTYNTNKDGGEKTQKQCIKLGAPEVLLKHLDVKNNDEIKNVVKEAAARFGKISVLVNNAGVNVWEDFQDHSVTDIRDVIDTNLTGLIIVTKEALGHVSDLIVNISSVLGYEVEKKESVYSASKWGVRGFTKALALELPIKIYSVNPRGTATKMNDFQGNPPEKIADLVLKLAKGEIDLPSGSDINAGDYLSLV